MERVSSIPMGDAGSNERYTLLAELGRGGMATAYLAAMRGPGGFNKLVVVKQLRPALASEEAFLTMFLDEAKLAARIEHPNVVHTNEVAYDGNRCFIAMEYIDGQSLDRVVRLAKNDSAAALPLNLHLYIISNMLSGLHYAHELKDFDGRPLNLVHRDVSPHNLMVTYGGHVKLVDFGIAKASTSSGATMTGVIKGKAAYMPAEQFGGAKYLDRRADVYAAGVMLWQALTGRRMWLKMNDSEIFVRVSMGNIPRPSSVAEVSPELEEIAMKALALKPEDRYATAADFQQALDDVIRRDASLYASARDLAAWMGHHFAEQRATISARIEATIGRLNATGSINPESLATLNASDRLSISASGSSSGGKSDSKPDSQSQSGITVDPMAPDDPLPPTVPPPSVTHTKSAAQNPEVGTSTSKNADRQWTPWLAAIGATAVAVGIGVISTITMHRRSATIALQVLPANASVFVDGARVEPTPDGRLVPLDAKIHRVRAEAPGYAPLEESLAFDGTPITMTLLARDPGVVAVTAPGSSSVLGASVAAPSPSGSDSAESFPDASAAGDGTRRANAGRWGRPNSRPPTSGPGPGPGGAQADQPRGGTDSPPADPAQTQTTKPTTPPPPSPSAPVARPGDGVPTDGRRAPRPIDSSNPLAAP